MLENRLHAVTVDLVALETVVRALARCQARTSPAALADLLDCLSIESARLGAGSCPNDPDVAGVCGVLDAWVEEIKAEGQAAAAA